MKPAIWPTIIVISLAALVYALSTGTISITPVKTLHLLFNPDDSVESRILHDLRVPRILAGFSAGALLSLAGLLMQVLLRNPLADPYVLGISGGASTAALLGMLLGVTSSGIPVMAFIGALFSILVVFSLAKTTHTIQTTRLLLTGVVLATGWGALISFILSVAPAYQTRGMLFWLMGDLSGSNSHWWHWLILIIAGTWFFLRANHLNILSHDERKAMSLGVAVKPLHLMIFLFASMMTAVAVTIAGAIGFVGLVIPHLLRLLFGHDHRTLIPSSILLGGSYLVIADTIARTWLAPAQLPVGVITALLGVPLFLFLLSRSSSYQVH